MVNAFKYDSASLGPHTNSPVSRLKPKCDLISFAATMKTLSSKLAAEISKVKLPGGTFHVLLNSRLPLSSGFVLMPQSTATSSSNRS